MVYISVVIPAYKSADCLPELIARLKSSLGKINENIEIIVINDGSPQNDWEVIKTLAQNDVRIKGYNLSRNFGQHNAIAAGLDKSEGEWIVVMDADLQDIPEEILKLYAETKNGYKIVFAGRVQRKDGFLKKCFSKVFYRLLGYLTDTKQDSSIGNFGIYHRDVINSIIRMGDNIRYFPAMIRWSGFKSTKVDVIHAERQIGDTSYSFRKLINLALNVILSFSEKPLKLTIKLGLFISFFSIIFTIYTLFRYIFNDITVIGWTSVMIAICFFSGLIIFALGITGLYVGKTFDKVKERPLYIISETINAK